AGRGGSLPTSDSTSERNGKGAHTTIWGPSPLTQGHPQTDHPPSKRADAARNRQRIIEAARAAFAATGAETSMAEIARRSGVGSATVYRNFGTRRELLEAL